MSTNHAAETAKIHARLSHPVIDSDGHWIEFEPAALDYLRQVGGERIVERYQADIGHFDVPDMTEVLVEAYEGVEDGLITEDDFRDFVFANPARFWAGANPNFFTGTAVETQVRKFLAETSRPAAAAAAS